MTGTRSFRATSRNAIATLLALAAAPAVAQDTAPPPALDLSATGAVVSDFRFRGVSRSNRRPAVQGAIDLAHASGAYASVWASSIDDRVAGGADAQVELAGGYQTVTATGINLDAGLRAHVFPGGRGGTDFVEPYAAVGYALGPVSAELRAHYAPRQRALGLDGRDRDNLYVKASASSAIPGTPLTLDAHLGRNLSRSALSFGTRYTEWGFGGRYVRGPLTLGLAYADTDRAFRTPAGRTLGGAGLVASASFSF